MITYRALSLFVLILLSLSLSNASAQTPTSVLSDSARLRITYEGYMEGSAKVQDRSRNTQLRFGNSKITLNGTRTVPIQASYYIEVTYEGNRVSATDYQKSDIPGVTARGTFTGTRNGDVCNLITNDGYKITATCNADRFEYEFNYTNPNGQEIKSYYSANKTKIVDIAEEERIKDAAAKAEAERLRAAAEARQRRIDERMARKLTVLESRIDAIITQDSASWLIWSYDRKSVTNAKSSTINETYKKLTADYTYNEGSPGQVMIIVSAEKVECIQFWNEPECRTLGHPASHGVMNNMIKGLMSPGFTNGSRRESDDEVYENQCRSQGKEPGNC